MSSETLPPIMVWNSPTEFERLLATIRSEHDFPPHISEQMLWLADTASVIADFTPEFRFYLKGGTCVQHYLASQTQRFSKDLDVGIVSKPSEEETNTKVTRILEYIQAVNEHLRRERGFGSDYGTFNYLEPPSQGNVVPVARFYKPVKFPARHNRLFNRSGGWILIDFFLHEEEPEFSKQELAIIPALHLPRKISLPIATRERLLADKIIVLFDKAQDPRAEPYKDILDLSALFEMQQKMHMERSLRFVNSWADSHKLKASFLVSGAANAIRAQKDEVTEQVLAQDINAILPRRMVFDAVPAWRSFCERVIERLMRLELGFP